jgi:hypothetical protein
VRAAAIAGPFLRKQSDIHLGNRGWDRLGQSFKTGGRVVNRGQRLDAGG